MVLGITGGLGSGKTTVLGAFSKLGCRVIDSDRIAHEVLKNRTVRKNIIEAFGARILDKKGAIDRKALGGLVFEKTSARRKLEALTQPEIIKRLKKAIASGRGITAVEVPLLFELKLEKMFDSIIVVYARSMARQERLMKERGLGREEFRKRDRAQLPLTGKKKLADYVINNSAEGAVYRQVKKYLMGISEYKQGK